MTVPKKKRCEIEVDGNAYYWTRASKSGRTENGWCTVQSGDGRGSLLRIDLYGIPTPVDIAEGIRFAIIHGWCPSQSGASFHLGFTNIRLDNRFVLRQADSPDFWTEFVP